jgi:hypothetical protein
MGQIAKRVEDKRLLKLIRALSCCRFHGHRVKVEQGTGDWRWDGDGLTELSSSRR